MPTSSAQRLAREASRTPSRHVGTPLSLTEGEGIIGVREFWKSCG